MTRVFLTKAGHKDLVSLEDNLQDRVKSKRRDAEAEPRRHLKRLQGHLLHYLRVGEHRVILDWDQTEDVLYVYAIAHRRNV